jgi:hypothetical protein
MGGDIEKLKSAPECEFGNTKTLLKSCVFTNPACSLIA